MWPMVRAHLCMQNFSLLYIFVILGGDIHIHMLCVFTEADVSLLAHSKSRWLGASLSAQSRREERISQVPQTFHLLCPGEDFGEGHSVLRGNTPAYVQNCITTYTSSYVGRFLVRTRVSLA